MQTNVRAIVAAVVAVLILSAKYLLPELSEQLDLIQNPLVDLISTVLLLYAGLQTQLVSSDTEG